jgi:hypothetical protein
MNKLEKKTKEISESGLMIELDMPAESVFMFATMLAFMKSESVFPSEIAACDTMLSHLIPPLEFNFPGTHELLFPDVELVNRKYEEL